MKQLRTGKFLRGILIVAGLSLLGCGADSPSPDDAGGDPVPPVAQTPDALPATDFECSGVKCAIGKEYCYRSYLDGQKHQRGCLALPENCATCECLQEKAAAVNAELNADACKQYFVSRCHTAQVQGQAHAQLFFSLQCER